MLPNQQKKLTGWRSANVWIYGKTTKPSILYTNSHCFLSLCSSQASPDSRHLTPLPRRPESRGLEATSPAQSSETGWYQDSGTGALPSPWCIVGPVVRLQSQRMSYQLLYQSCHLSQGKVRRRWRMLMTGSTAHVPGENTRVHYLKVI